MDTTQDVAKVDQMSQIFRYVVIERDSQGVDIFRDDITEDLPFQLLSFRACLK
ncbi:Hypothetical protein FKW44_010153 [Caligus rogercresseyi]|uniref:Uncharacterized protein n=1 Tax=Caligus rogercresseyi TaxID=217165 RepID=A0A7T8HH80_CALRO|nr:Hypothetical protein FKW44_010153 [Caligus rogercresseyi]